MEMKTRATAASARKIRRRPDTGPNTLPILNPTWLLDPPQGQPPAPPSVTRAQLLPFSDLIWQDFERLCLRLAKTEGKPDHWQLFGESGEEQGGIDIFVRHPNSNRYVVWQAKRHKVFSAAKLNAAVKLFLNGEWAGQTSTFVLATSTSLRSSKLVTAVEAAAKELAAHEITFIPMDIDRLSDRLKNHPEIVDDFFDRAWVERFCGSDAAAALGDRLGRHNLADLRTRLASVYSAHFASVDPGVIRATGMAVAPPIPLPLGVRFVPPDLYTFVESKDSQVEADRRRQTDNESVRQRDDSALPQPPNVLTPEPAHRLRQTLEVWSGSFERTIIVGSPGAGKSTLLRFLALDIFATEPLLRQLRERWPGYLPIWISFPFWTRQIASAAAGTVASLERIVAQWLELQGEPGLVPLVSRALAEGQVILLVDGVDEWFDEAAAGTALTLLNAMVQRRQCPVVVSSRPYGERVLRNLDAAWERRELAPLTSGQQVEFATTWFEVGAEVTPARARAKAQAFVAEIRRSSELVEVAGVPLLFGGLIALRLSGANLPRSRFKAYAELAARLLDVQPAARDLASLRSRHSDELDRDTRERVLCALAFHIQEHTTAHETVDALTKTTATAFCKGFLERELELPPHEAHRRAAQLIDLGEQSLGVLVQKSPRDVGFLHRVFQEFLAAKHLSTQDLDVQLDVVRAHATEARWRDILLFTTYFLTRASEIDRVVTVLEEKKVGDPDRDWSVTLLLADIAFGTMSRKPETVRRLAADLFTEVETGTVASLREEVLRRVIGGLSGEATSNLVRTRLRQ
jgi:energy-coupling factor transporter ATP-binding protein EcfA2